MMTNKMLTTGEQFWITLYVTNTTDHEIYVPKHFNSNNYAFNTATTSAHSHGDSWGAVFEEFVRLKPSEAMQFTTAFLMLDDVVGDGEFSVSFYNNMLPEVKRKLELTGVPFVVELKYTFGQIKVESSSNRKRKTGT
jgi:hypothetical protein